MSEGIPGLPNVLISLSQWIFMYIGLIALRAELHPWVNTIILTAVYPMYIWYMCKSNVIGIITFESMLALIIASTLAMTAVLEAAPKLKTVQNIKKSLKEYGKKPKETITASLIISMAILLGTITSYTVTRSTFVKS